MSSFRLGIDYQPRGDQQTAIDALMRGLKDGEQHQVLLGVTGSGKTFTMAKIIERSGRPALVLAHNKTLAAQLYQEFKTFFPSNAVEYFVSYYDYYQPEAYIPSGDVYIDFPDTGMSLEAVERALLVRALEKAGGNQSAAARLLGVSRDTLRYRMEKFGLGD